eukprot:CAMPEP_0178395418 /NCGR_PEP_ID=MMETSP0689_2-20121128/13209_1 /TAXON_ID=160604 /ORGANISM="Amphidinium massartii, Strain CS-259" /LENGTH=670 /DNA_ID=CAMNT_0020016073 /DNA_START=1 /DNA_END=2009 /DNA_ORIENTATION=-
MLRRAPKEVPWKSVEERVAHLEEHVEERVASLAISIDEAKSQLSEKLRKLEEREKEVEEKEKQLELKQEEAVAANNRWRDRIKEGFLALGREIESAKQELETSITTIRSEFQGAPTATELREVRAQLAAALQQLEPQHTELRRRMSQVEPVHTELCQRVDQLEDAMGKMKTLQQPVKAPPAPSAPVSPRLPPASGEQLNAMASDLRQELASVKAAQSVATEQIASHTARLSSMKAIQDSSTEQLATLGTKLATHGVELERLRGVVASSPAVVNAPSDGTLQQLAAHAAELAVHKAELDRLAEQMPGGGSSSPRASIKFGQGGSPDVARQLAVHSQKLEELAAKLDGGGAGRSPRDVPSGSPERQLTDINAKIGAHGVQIDKLWLAISGKKSIIGEDPALKAMVEAHTEEMATLLDRQPSAHSGDTSPNSDYGSAAQDLVQKLVENSTKVAQEASGALLAEHTAELAKHASELESLRRALVGQPRRPSKPQSADAANRNRLMDSVRLSPTAAENLSPDLRVCGTKVTWLVRDIPGLLQSHPKGKCVESPPFAAIVPGVGKLQGLSFRFFPNGGHNAVGKGSCSLYLAHPIEVPWVQFELTVGNARRGTFDPIFGGIDDFCELEPQLQAAVLEVGNSGLPVLLVGVNFLPPAEQRLQSSRVGTPPTGRPHVA